jgi:hypothetical protein
MVTLGMLFLVAAAWTIPIDTAGKSYGLPLALAIIAVALITLGGSL